MTVLSETALLNIIETKDLFVISESQASLRKHLGQIRHIIYIFSFHSSFSMFTESISLLSVLSV